MCKLMLNDAVPALAKPTEVDDQDEDGTPDLMVKFDRGKVQDILDVGHEVETTITGEVAGIVFEGSNKPLNSSSLSQRSRASMGVVSVAGSKTARIPSCSASWRTSVATVLASEAIAGQSFA